MSVEFATGVRSIAHFITVSAPPPAARGRAAAAFRDTFGVMLAGVTEPAARAIHDLIAEDGGTACTVVGTARRASPTSAALANGVAAHALDYDDMCFVSLAHPSCALVPAILAAAESTGASGAAMLDAYVAGFELECRLGLVMNPRHYHQRGWHCTSTIGTVGAAAAAARVFALDADATANALGIAASAACGLKENLGTMVKPLHAGLAAQSGVMAARLARGGYVASARALDGPQGFLAAMDSERTTLEPAIGDLGSRWEILDSGITVKLYPSCAATHPPLDALLDLRRGEAIEADAVDSVDVEVDAMTTRLLIYARPSTALEAKFSMPFCAAAALVHGHVGVDTFDAAHIESPAIQRLLPRVRLHANAAFDASAPLSRARVTVRLRDGRVITRDADGARGYPGRLTDEELAVKFRDCARRVISAEAAERAWDAVADIEHAGNARQLLASFAA